MTTLQDLKTEYQAKLDEQAAEEATQEQAKEALRQLRMDGLRPRIITWLANREGVEEAELTEFGAVAGEWDEWENKLRTVVFTLTIPEHRPIAFSFSEDAEGHIRPANGNKSWYIQQTHERREMLGPALVLAARSWQDAKEHADTQAAYEAEREARKAAEKEQAKDAQLQLYMELAKDPTALLLLKLFAEIQWERAGASDQIANLEEAMGNAEYYHDEALSRTRRQVEQANSEVERVKSEAESLRYRVDDLDSELTKVKRRSRAW